MESLFERDGAEKYGGQETAYGELGSREPYNNEIPLIRGEKVPVGCGATAAAIVMRYHRHPTHAENGVAFYYGKSLDYTPYRWEMMPLDYLGGYNEEERPAGSYPDVAYRRECQNEL